MTTDKLDERNSYQPDIVIYHDKCIDGFTAAWACWKRWGDAPQYIACDYGMAPPPILDGKHVLIVDFSFSELLLRDMVENGRAASVLVLDHHKTAQADLAPFQRMKDKPHRFTPSVAASMNADLKRGGYPQISALFDMERSGAGMAWDFAMSAVPRPMLVDLVEDRDLWRFALGDASKFLHLALTSGEATFQRWDEADRNIDSFVAQGQAISAYRDSLVDEIVQRAALVLIDDLWGVGVDCPYALASDVGHRLLDGWPDASFAAAIVRGQETVSYSLRSRDDRIDVSAIAKKFGGGGHRNAAGFKVPRA